MTPTFRQSAIATHADCARRFNLQYIGRYRRVKDPDQPPEPTVAELGTMFHSMVETRLRNWPDPPELEQFSVKHQAMFRAMRDRYMPVLEEEMKGRTLLFLEEQHERVFVTRAGKVKVTGRIDQLWRNPDGSLHMVDVKTVGNRNQAPSPNDFQLRTYAVLLDPKRPFTVSHHSVLRVTKPRSGNTVRISDVMLTPEDNTLFIRNTLIPAIENMLFDEKFVPRTSRDCGWKCSYEDVCIEMDYADGDPETLLNSYFTVEVDDDRRI